MTEPTSGKNEFSVTPAFLGRRTGRRIDRAGHLAAIAAAALVAALLVMIPAAPASADTGLCGGVGTATVGAPGNGLYYPVVGPKKTLPFTFGGGLLGGVTCVTLEGGKTLTAFGTINGYCGQSYGVGVAFGNSPHRFQFISSGGVLVITGEITGLATALPDPTIAGNSCLPTGGGAFSFIVAGHVVKNHAVPVIPPPAKYPPALPYPCQPLLTPPFICGP